MSISTALEQENHTFRTQYLQTLQGLMLNAAEFGLERMTRESSVRELINTGHMGIRREEDGTSNPEHTPSVEDGTSLITDLYPFLERVYLRAMGRSGALARQRELEILSESLEQEKKERFRNLSQSTVTDLESIMNTDLDHLSAQSRKQIDKSSYTRVREVGESAETTQRKLDELTRRKKVDATGIYQRLEKKRIELDAQERARSKSLGKSVGKAQETIHSFFAIFQEVMGEVATINFGRLPDVASLEEVPLVQREELENLFARVLAADRTITPQGELDREEPFRMPQLVLVPASGYMIAATALAAEAYRENVIFVPLRLLERPVKGLSRELLRFRRRVFPKVASSLEGEYEAYRRSQTGELPLYDRMYELYLCFALGQTGDISALPEAHQAVLLRHFVPGCCPELYEPSSLRGVTPLCTVGDTRGRAFFNEAIQRYRQSPFALGMLYADRALKYHALQKNLASTRPLSAESQKKVEHSTEKDFAAALMQLGKVRGSDHEIHMARFNQGMLLCLYYGEGILPDMAAKAIGLFRQSLRRKSEDIWALRARQRIETLTGLLSTSSSASVAATPAAGPVSGGVAEEAPGLLQRLLMLAKRTGGSW